MIEFILKLFRKPRPSREELLAQREKELLNLEFRPEDITSGPFPDWAVSCVNRWTKAKKNIEAIDQELLVVDANEIINPHSNG